MSTPAGGLVLADPESLRDLATFVGRAKGAVPEGAVRLQAVGSVLATWVGLLDGSGLASDGAVLGLRTVALAEPSELDVCVPLAALTDRTARAGAADVELPIPPQTVAPRWAALTPPRGGWEPVGTLPAELLHEAARAGIAEIALGSPDGAGSHAVAALRQRVWAAPTASTPPVPAGAAFGLHVLGFLTPGEGVTVHAAGRWTRVTTTVGFVLTR
ncbi:hypothetical protein [Janibacter sp. G56]|uniref:hypothetical protein n=1 Tax=Janibacter sp. G56 TaxID=3418717 RepID=UPI003CFD56C7